MSEQDRLRASEPEEDRTRTADDADDVEAHRDTPRASEPDDLEKNRDTSRAGEPDDVEGHLKPRGGV